MCWRCQSVLEVTLLLQEMHASIYLGLKVNLRCEKCQSAEAECNQEEEKKSGLETRNRQRDQHLGQLQTPGPGNHDKQALAEFPAASPVQTNDNHHDYLCLEQVRLLVHVCCFRTPCPPHVGEVIRAKEATEAL